MKKKRTVLVADYERGVIWLDGWISPHIASRFQKMLVRLNKQGLTHIIFYIRGPGGDPYSAFEMMNNISSSNAPVITVAHDYVRSGCFTLTQAGSPRLALKGTRFTFHPAVVTVKRGELTQEQVLGILEGLRLIDAMQLSWFLKKAKPVKKIFALLIYEKTIGLTKAKRLRVMDDYYEERDFFSDKRKITKLLKSKRRTK